MPQVRILTEEDLRRLVTLDMAAIDCVEAGFRALSGGEVVMPPILSMAIEAHNGEVDVKTAYVPGIDSFAIKVSPGFFDNPKLGLPSTSGLMILFSALTGQIEALLLDNGYLTDIRTAAAGAVAARRLAREDASSAAVFGAGVQARLQVRALCLVRPIRRVVFWARDVARAEAAARETAERLGIDARAEAAPDVAAKGADVILTTTPATAPILMADWLTPGQHVTAMGSDQHTKNEIEPACLVRADLYVPDRLNQTRALGELRTAIAAGLVDAGAGFAELGDIVAGEAPGRRAATQITIADLTGTGVQDTAIASFARQRADAAGAGVNFTT
ncbi:ectoine utilization protein EutC [Pikeienuella piscinae]|uniref:Ectoine utilization protein EutC n=1 Tax=Pikeienuella piscinae TaxID=2748098 RepID=A0A7L5BTN4_9RHOB|nr:ectoine utilization protein EutC [Pikeienuella piscinae]QIE55460.1 ectoine utilization protein EutC [Pikeienuella piscinae]